MTVALCSCNLLLSLYIAFIYLTRAFDLVSRDGIFEVLPKIGCPPILQSMIAERRKEGRKSLIGKVYINISWYLYNTVILCSTYADIMFVILELSFSENSKYD